MEVPFIHLHCHSHYSLLDGAGTIKGLVERAKALGMPALAITDHGNLYGALEFYQTAQKEGIKPIIGYEAYVSPGCRTDKTAVAKKKDAYSHLTLLAFNHTGYKNLLKLSSLAHLEGFYHKPRIDRAILEQYNEGLLCLSGCASSEIARLLLEETPESFDKAKAVGEWYRELFGDRYYLEIQYHGLAIQKTILEGTRKLSNELNVPMAATNDVHYVYHDDEKTQDMLLCVSRNKLYKEWLQEKDKEKKTDDHSDQFFFRSGVEMRRALPGFEDAIAQTVEIADRVDVQLDLSKRYFPVFVPPKGLSTDAYLRQLCLDGLKRRYANNPKRLIEGELSEEVLARLDRELSVIENKGFSDYFLVVWDLVRVAEERGIHRTARGSAVGALVSYALDMSHVCPLEYDLLFERFLDESRAEAPDIDIDFDQDRRDEILDYITEKYGKDNVARLGTFGTMAVKSSIKDVGRALDIPLSAINDITKLIDKAKNLKAVLKDNAELNNLYKEKAEIKELFDFAQKIEGLAKNTGVHACGVIIADKPLIEYVPIQLDKFKEKVVTQWEGADVETAGLLKMDILGLQNLTILAHSIELIKQTTGTTLDPYNLPLEDKKTFELFCRGETKGIFQFESPGMREYLQRLKPDNFRDIIAMAAMYRPGPMDLIDDYIAVKHKKKKAVYEHPILEEILTETNGIMVYQEQVMRILNRLGNIPLGDAYACIKAIGKKKDFSKYRADFVEGVKANGLPAKKGEDIFDLISKFAGYGFNKSHATAYALIAYITAYLKVHYPVEFMAALLCGDISQRNFAQQDSTVIHIEDCKRMGIEIIPPDVNTSKQLYSVVDGKIAFALTAIKGCGGGWAADKIVESREKHGKFKSLFDFCERADSRACNRTTIEMLIKAGAFDSLGYKRSQLFQMVETAIKAGQGAAEDAAKGQGNLFGGADDEPEEQALSLPGMPNIPEWTDNEKAIHEKEVLGYYLSSHPLEAFAETFARLRTHECGEVSVLPERVSVVLTGIVTEIKFATTKDGKKYANFTLEDASGGARSIMWAETYEQHSHLIKSETVVCMRGKMNRRKSVSKDSPDGNFVPDEAWAIDMAIMLDEERHTEESVCALLRILDASPGSGEVELSLRLKSGAVATFNGRHLTASVTPALRQRIVEFLGPGTARIGESVAKRLKRSTGQPAYRRY